MKNAWNSNAVICILFIIVLSSCQNNNEIIPESTSNASTNIIMSGISPQTGTAIPTITSTPSITLTTTSTNLPTNSYTATLTDTIGPTITPTEIFAITATRIGFHITGNSYKDYKCGVNFEYPLKWVIEIPQDFYLYGGRFGNTCSFGLRPENMSIQKSQADYCMGDYGLYMDVVDAGLEETASKGLFTYENSNWYTIGRQGITQPAEMIKTRGLYILRGQVAVGMSDATCNGPWWLGIKDRALVSAGGNKSVVLEDDSTKFNLHFEYVLQTISIMDLQ